MIKRDIEDVFQRYLQSFPVVLVTGARQVGKTTLAKAVLKDSHAYVLLESPDIRELANMDPRRFLEHNAAPVIFDEFQMAPELSSYLQEAVDDQRSKKGMYVLTGSQNFAMMEQVTQSLAGRVGILNLYGLSSNEIPRSHLSSSDRNLGYLFLRGSYPELWQDKAIHSKDWYASYTQTYIERDVRRLANIGDVTSFERFLKVCAARTGQVLNKSDIASDVGVAQTTVTRWISLLEQSYIIKLVQPYYKNVSSRIRKAPKLYFLDTGLASYLMGFKDEHSILNAPQYGSLFETLVYSNFIKKHASQGDIPDHYFLETKSRLGVDFIIEHNKQLQLVEIKGAKTFSKSLCEQLLITKKELGDSVAQCTLIMAQDKPIDVGIDDIEIEVRPWHSM